MFSLQDLEHVQLDMPPGQELVARAFYGSVLGLAEIVKPEPLRASGVWFAAGPRELHLSAVPDARPALRGHAGLHVVGLTAFADRCSAAGHAVEYDHRYPGRTRFYVRDPFGNRLELFELEADAARSARLGTQPTLETKRLILRPYETSDAPAVQRLAGAREVADMTLHIPHPYPDGLAEAWIARHPREWAAGKLATFAIEERDTGELTGTIGLVIDAGQASAEIAYWIAVPRWGRGYATEAGHAILDFAFDRLNVHRVQGRHFTRNPASGRVMQKLGMRYEGVMRQSMRRDASGPVEDVAVYALLATDPRPPRVAARAPLHGGGV